jgi:hypothetical protein
MMAMRVQTGQGQRPQTGERTHHGLQHRDARVFALRLCGLAVALRLLCATLVSFDAAAAVARPPALGPAGLAHLGGRRGLHGVRVGGGGRGGRGADPQILHFARVPQGHLQRAPGRAAFRRDRSCGAAGGSGGGTAPGPRAGRQ